MLTPILTMPQKVPSILLEPQKIASFENPKTYLQMADTRSLSPTLTPAATKKKKKIATFSPNPKK